jgi:hypothetical protein
MLLAQVSSRATSRSADARLFGGSRAVRWLSALRLVGLMEAFLSMAVRRHLSLTPLAPRNPASVRFVSLTGDLCNVVATGLSAKSDLSHHPIRSPTDFLRRTCPQFADCARLD